MATEAPIAEAFLLIAERFGREHGSPLPKQLLEIGDRDRGWGVKLNPTNETIEDVEPYRAHVSWNGWPAGIIDPYGGCLAAGHLANEDALCEWLKSDLS